MYNRQTLSFQSVSYTYHKPVLSEKPETGFFIIRPSSVIKRKTATPKIRSCGQILSFYDTKITYYSIILATRPEPTVLPPSRFVGNIIIMFSHVLYWILYSYSSISAMLFEVFKLFRTKIEPQSISSELTISSINNFYLNNRLPYTQLTIFTNHHIMLKIL